MASRTHVAVIGAGVIGLSCARELARAGFDVTVLEAAPTIGRGSSALANGGIRAQFTTEINIAFSRFSIAELETLERTVGGLGLYQTGYLMLAGAEASERRLRDAAELQRRLGLDGAGGRTPMTVGVDTGVLVRREPAGGWVIAYADPDDPPGWDTSVDPAFLPALAARLPNRFPSILDLPIDPSQCWAGLYPETPDHHAIVGEDPGVPGFLHCVGFGGHGLMHAPAAGRAITELDARGRSETFDMRPLRPSRCVEGTLAADSAVL